MDVVLLYLDKRLQPCAGLSSVITRRINLLQLNAAVCPVVSAVVCHPGAHAGAHVKAQDLQPQPAGLSQDMPVPEMAENGSPTR